MTIFCDVVKKEWAGSSYWVKGTYNSCGVAILFRKNLHVNNVNIPPHVDERFLRLDCSIAGEKLTICTIYCPNQITARNNFINDLVFQLDTSRPLIVLGDWNFIPDIDKDRVNFHAIKPDRRLRAYHVSSNKKFQIVSDIYHLVDVFRHMYPQVKDYTCFTPQYATGTRLDRVYVASHLLDRVQSIRHVPVMDTDHKIVHLEISVGNYNIGKGYWKCNVTIFKDQYFDDDFAALCSHFCSITFPNAHHWEHFKQAAKDLIIFHSRRVSDIRKSRIREIETLLSHETDLDTINCYRTELKSLLDYRTETLRILTKSAEIDNRDKPTKLLLKREKDRANNSFVSRLENQGLFVCGFLTAHQHNIGH